MLAFWIDTNDGIVMLTYDDRDTTFGEWAAALDQILAHPDFEPEYGFLSDRRLAPAPPTTENVKNSVAYLHSQDRLKHVRWATVVDGTADFGMGRMSELLAQGYSDGRVTIRVFRDLHTAREWLLDRTRA